MDWFLYDIGLRHERVKESLFHFGEGLSWALAAKSWLELIECNKKTETKLWLFSVSLVKGHAPHYTQYNELSLWFQRDIVSRVQL